MNREKFYLQTWFIALLFALWPLFVPPLIGVILMMIQKKQREKEFVLHNELLKQNEEQIKILRGNLENEKETSLKNLDKEKAISLLYKQKLDDIGADRYEEVTKKVEEANLKLDELAQATNQKNLVITQLNLEIERLTDETEKYNKQLNNQTRRLARIKELYKAVEYATKTDYLLSDKDSIDYDQIAPSVMLKLHCMDVKELRKAFKENEKQIKKLLELYSSRYSTKANIAIYNLMVIALMAELQNILHELKYEKLDTAIDNVKAMTAKYLEIAGNGNQNIVGTLTKFIGEIEYLFMNAVKIEYNYYVKKEQAKQEQMALREQMRNEAAERKALEAEKKKIEKEEQKFKAEIDKISELMAKTENDSEMEKLRLRILQLEGQLVEVAEKKHEITNLQNGKAGTVYVISNLGSFGENVFKIGMTRRLEPLDRVNELGDASVPFKFDVHSLIFSKDAVNLENKMHTILNDRRVNKVNLRKEFFNISIDELEKIVNDIEPTAEFNKTMIAEEFKQSLSTHEVYTSIASDEDEE